MLANPARFAEACRLFDAANADDPTQEPDEHGQPVPKELLYAQRMSTCLARVAPAAPEAVQLAARSQHIRRWHIPRSDYPLTRPGYHQWRNALKQYHAELAGELLLQAGYGPDLIARVQQLLRKERLRDDPEVQLLEDVICLVFLEYYFLPFAAQHPEEKVVEIVQKTWPKMTERGHALALQLPFSPEALALVTKALG
ncbi:MAG: DUF4202 domain-containing protein [Janthinobacterium lividum]